MTAEFKIQYADNTLINVVKQVIKAFPQAKYNLNTYEINEETLQSIKNIENGETIKCESIESLWDECEMELKSDNA